ncbi:MAG: hypothetical protein ABJO97_22705 [Roseibium sp.]|uniref:hypothetical protein n=1 Tax=Roseibium TaxID=150830 RepID=UPI00326641AD
MGTVHLSLANKMASAPVAAQPDRYVLTKVSRAGRRYFHTGIRHIVELDDGARAPVVRTSLFAGDAKVYDRSQGDDIARIVAYYNLDPISDAVWTAVPLDAALAEWGAS